MSKQAKLPEIRKGTGKRLVPYEEKRRRQIKLAEERKKKAKRKVPYKEKKLKQITIEKAIPKKPKKKRKKKVEVGLSKPHRRRASKVSGYFRRRTRKAFRLKKHKRNPRRTKEQIEKYGTREEERKAKRLGINVKELRRRQKISEAKKK